MWADESPPFPPDLPKELAELPKHCVRCGIPEVGYLIPRRTASVRFAQPPPTPQYVITANPFSVLESTADVESKAESEAGTDVQSHLPEQEASRPPSPAVTVAETTPTPMSPLASTPSASPP